jgi:peroxiredoxin family protein
MIQPQGAPSLQSDKAGLALIVQAGGYDRVHYALVMAAAACASGRRVVLFFTGRALLALLEGKGWHRLDVSDDGSSAANRDAALAARGVATFEELLAACSELGVRIIACEMGWRALDMDDPPLRQEATIETAGAVTFLASIAPGDHVLFI